MSKLVVTMPEATVIVERLHEMVGHGSDIERLARRFAERVGGRNLRVHGVVIAWELIVRELSELEGAIPMFPGMANMLFDDAMRAMLVESSDFADEVIAFYEQVLNEARVKRA